MLASSLWKFKVVHPYFSKENEKQNFWIASNNWLDFVSVSYKSPCKYFRPSHGSSEPQCHPFLQQIAYTSILIQAQKLLLLPAFRGTCLVCSVQKQSRAINQVTFPFFNTCHLSTPINPDFLILFNFADTLHLRFGIQGPGANSHLFVPRYVLLHILFSLNLLWTVCGWTQQAFLQKILKRAETKITGYICGADIFTPKRFGV